MFHKPTVGDAEVYCVLIGNRLFFQTDQSDEAIARLIPGDEIAILGNTYSFKAKNTRFRFGIKGKSEPATIIERALYCLCEQKVRRMNVLEEKWLQTMQLLNSLMTKKNISEREERFSVNHVPVNCMRHAGNGSLLAANMVATDGEIESSNWRDLQPSNRTRSRLGYVTVENASFFVFGCWNQRQRSEWSFANVSTNHVKLSELRLALSKAGSLITEENV